MRKPAPLLITALLSATAAFGHSGIENRHVQAWVGCMMALAEGTETLGQMAKGQVPFNQERAEHALTAIRHHAAAIPELFRTEADDPKSEAGDAIWLNWDDFVDRSDRLVKVTEAAEITDPDQVRQALDLIGKACKSCHADYRD